MGLRRIYFGNSQYFTSTIFGHSEPLFQRKDSRNQKATGRSGNHSIHSDKITQCRAQKHCSQSINGARRLAQFPLMLDQVVGTHAFENTR